jgi:DNA-directed RNA polymerase II subunit RPB2|uniref:DNA-directed RNA polymerase n=1 Tax=viral metagenome TaxID=1070528 RepID=A0A6C0JFR6_9ZZZZ
MSKSKSSIDVTNERDINDFKVDANHDIEKNTLSDSPENMWTLIESYFGKNHLKQMVRHQIESFDVFVQHQIKQTIDMFHPLNIHSEQDYNSEHDKYVLEMNISFEKFKLYRPQIHENNGATKLMFPQEARLRNFTYASNMTLDIHIQYITRSGDNLEDVQHTNKIIPNVYIGKLPIMLKSSSCLLTQYKHVNHDITGECKYDAGGYFIINGSEKTVLGQERAAENKVYCYNISKNNTKYNWIAELKSVPDYKQISPKQINMYVSSKNNGFGFPLHIQIPRIKVNIPLFILFRALGVVSDAEICRYILLKVDGLPKDSTESVLLEQLKASIIDANEYLTQESAIEYIKENIMYTPLNMDKEAGEKKRIEFTQDVLKNDLLPHCQTTKHKIYYLGYMCNSILKVSSGFVEHDDRDSYLNKRIDTTGTLLNNLFRNYFNKLVKDMQKLIVKEINTGSWRSTYDYTNIVNHTNIYKIVKSTTIENGIKRALSTGDFGIKQSNSSKVGVAQVLNRLTYASSLSHSRRISTPIDKSGKLIPPRMLHNTSWGFLCPAETPEGQSVGVVKNLSYMTHITLPSDTHSIHEYINGRYTKIEDVNADELFDKVKVFVNGVFLGVTDDPQDLYAYLKDLKTKGMINIYTSVVFNYSTMEIRVCNERGRLARPVLRVKNNAVLLNDSIVQKIAKGQISWDNLLTNILTDDSVIEYIDPDEQNNTMIAMYNRDLKAALKDTNRRTNFTHCEIHPSTIFGVLASCIPFPEHNQSPRNTYQCAMSKQSMGVYMSNYDNRMDKTAYVLNYPMRPLVDTRIMNIIRINDIPSGSPVIVAIMTHTGYNQEDSVLFNKGAIDRGLFIATVYHTEKDEDKKINGDEEVRCKPDPSRTRGMKFGNYNKINTDGVISENTLVENRDVIIAKMVPIKENKNDHTKVVKFEDQSKIFKTTEDTYIDKNYIQRNGDGYKFAKVKTRITRKPVIGDKFSSRHGQKGTIGNIIPEEDMPFTKDGLKPDIIINPHAIPSRMTIGQLKETLLGKVLVELGLFGDGTSFGEFQIDDIAKELLNVGYEQNGNQVMYDGLTGEQLESSIFIGPVFYQRLKHMVNDKQHSRSIGPMVNLTRQPAEGRSRDGGLRFGEMERDCMISHGASRFTKGRIYDASDKFQVHLCKKCGMIAAYNDKLHIHHCRMCDNRTDFVYSEIPYACKLLFQELMTMNIAPRLITNDIN